jgi:hypothetical protein
MGQDSGAGLADDLWVTCHFFRFEMAEFLDIPTVGCLWGMLTAMPRVGFNRHTPSSGKWQGWLIAVALGLVGVRTS